MIRTVAAAALVLLLCGARPAWSDASPPRDPAADQGAPGAPGNPGNQATKAPPTAVAPAASVQQASNLPSGVPAATIGTAELIADPRALEVIGPHDLLEIAVFEIDQLSRTVRVSDDGSITLPFLGRLEAGGLSRSALEEKIARLLGDKFVQDPQVSVFVKEYNSHRVSVGGAVKNPATFELMGRKTLLDVVSEAGGFTEEVGRTVYVIRRSPDGAADRLAIDLERLIYGSDPADNIPIQPGDVIYAPIEETITVYVNGAVKNPGGYEFRHGDQITVLRAITKAGGTTERASEKHVQILRAASVGGQSAIPVDLRKIRAGKILDPVLQPEDVVDVPEAFF